ncbi:hypothetical protein B566_EDAN005601 [Ephemera danica]|nr:hypothetical protein B566_EDAN005601 [Ephemera danica]
MKNTESLFKEQMHEKLPEIIINDKNQTDFIPQPSTSAAPRNVKVPVILKEESQTNLGFQFNIWLEKEGFGKFDDIVLQYNKPDGKRTLICVQCKHGEEKINPDGTRTMEEFEDALNIYNDIIEKRTEILGEEHPHTLSTTSSTTSSSTVAPTALMSRNLHQNLRQLGGFSHIHHENLQHKTTGYVCVCDDGYEAVSMRCDLSGPFNSINVILDGEGLKCETVDNEK